ncbi:unnamed protein product [Closterium sp. Naga37s-1]|nr:unnamed protein product [Closterium sp. Naga37s-1]
MEQHGRVLLDQPEATLLGKGLLEGVLKSGHGKADPTSEASQFETPNRIKGGCGRSSHSPRSKSDDDGSLNDLPFGRRYGQSGRHGQELILEASMYDPHPIFDTQIWNEEESGLLEERLRRQGRLEGHISLTCPILAPPFMQDQPRPCAEDPQISAQSQQESGLLEELLRRHGRLEDPFRILPPLMHDQPYYKPPPHAEDLQILTRSQQESGLLEELLRRHGRLEDPIRIPPLFMHDQPRSPFEELPQVSDSEADHLLRGHKQLERPIRIPPPFMYSRPCPPFEEPLQVSDPKAGHGQLEDSTAVVPLGNPPPRLPMQLQAPEISHQKDDGLLGHHGQLEDSIARTGSGSPPSRVPLLPQEPVALKSRSTDSLERAVAGLLEEQQRQQQQQQQEAVESWIVHALHASAPESMVAVGYGGVSTTVDGDPMIRVANNVVSGSGGIKSIDREVATTTEKTTMSIVAASCGGTNTIDRDGAASAQQHLVQQQQQVATTSWVAQAELSGLALPPDLI